VLRTRPPRSTPERVRARLACIRHAASVDPEPGSNSPPRTPKGPLTLARRDSLPSPSDSVESPQSEENVPAPSRPALACDGHALLWLTCCCWASRSDPGPGPQARSSLLRSLRLRHTTPGPEAPSVEKPSPAVRCASLSTCCPARRGNLGTAAAASPLHPFHPAARSTIGGRSSPEPAKLTLPPATLSRLGARAIAFCFSLGGDALEQRSRFPRETLHVASSNLGNPISLLRHRYYVK
jgi:hypothetical protein